MDQVLTLTQVSHKPSPLHQGKSWARIAVQRAQEARGSFGQSGIRGPSSFPTCFPFHHLQVVIVPSSIVSANMRGWTPASDKVRGSLSGLLFSFVADHGLRTEVAKALVFLRGQIRGSLLPLSFSMSALLQSAKPGLCFHSGMRWSSPRRLGRDVIGSQ